MKALRYFLDSSDGILFAYEKESDFLVVYNFGIEEWVNCEFSFMQVRHDRELSEISVNEATAKVGSKSADEEYQKYLNILNLNGSVTNR